MLKKIRKFFWKAVTIRNFIEFLIPESLLHLDEVDTQSIISLDLIAAGEMVYF
jgi:hypothetical protein